MIYMRVVIPQQRFYTGSSEWLMGFSSLSKHARLQARISEFAVEVPHSPCHSLVLSSSYANFHKL